MNRNNEQKKIDNSKMLNIISRGDVLLLLAVILMLGALAIWMFRGTISETISAKGVITCSNDSFKVNAPESGTISEMNYTMSDYISKGDLIARIVKDNYNQAPDSSDEVETMNVISEESGFVTEIQGYKGDKVINDAPLLTMIEADPEDLDEVLVLVDYETLDLIHSGTKVRVCVDGFSEERFGYISGEVVDIDLRLINKRRLSHMIGNEAVTENLIEGGGSFVVKVRLDKDDDGHFLFSKKKIDSSSLQIDSPCDVMFVIDEINPGKMFLGDE